jgi:phosphoglucomutase
MSVTTIDLAKEWLNSPLLTEQEKKELKELLLKSSETEKNELEERFYKNLEFGTAGLRGIVGIGTNRMNEVTVRRAALAIAKEITGCVVVSYDSRLTSEKFAQITAEVMASNGIKVFRANTPTATPILSYAVRHYKAAAGIMITASHNPKDYNGYKVYGPDGGQVTPPLDKKIMDRYLTLSSLAELEKSTVVDQNVLGKDIAYFDDTFFNAYFNELSTHTLRPQFVKDQGLNLSIIYTPLHGTGALSVERALSNIGFTTIFTVPEQRLPDGHFPTAAYPNPEDPKALELGKKYLLEKKADVLIGSDPDTDRMGIMTLEEGKTHFINGNDIASFMLYYKLLTLKEQEKLSAKALIIKSIVTSELQDAIASYFHCSITHTLTGFKWMAQVLKEKEDNNTPYQFIFASEESFGSMPNEFVRDKDGIASACLLSEALLYFKSQNKSLLQVMKEIRALCGYHYERVLNYSFPGKMGMKSMEDLMNYLRTSWKELPGVLSCQDFFESQLTELPKTNMVRLEFKGSKIYVRPSGTEPKIKFYLMIHEEHEITTDEAFSSLTKVVDSLIKKYL